MPPWSQQEVFLRPAFCCSGLAGTSVSTSVCVPWCDSAACVSSLFLSVSLRLMGTDSFILYFCTKLLYNAQTIAVRTPSWEQINECGPPFLKRIRH